MADANKWVQNLVHPSPIGLNVEHGTRRTATPELVEWLDDDALTLVILRLGA